MVNPRKNKWDEYSDSELVLMYKKAESQELLAALFTRYTETLFGICMKYLKNTYDASDMVQDVYIRVAKYLLTNEVNNFRGWIGVVTRNACLKALEKERSDIFTELLPEKEIVATDNGLSELLENEKNFDKAGNCLGSLNPNQRKVIDLFYLKEHCYKEIAKMIEAEVKTVRTLIQNARRNLRICMENPKSGLA